MINKLTFPLLAVLLLAAAPLFAAPETESGLKLFEISSSKASAAAATQPETGFSLSVEISASSTKQGLSSSGVKLSSGSRLLAQPDPPADTAWLMY